MSGGAQAVEDAITSAFKWAGDLGGAAAGAGADAGIYKAIPKGKGGGGGSDTSDSSKGGSKPVIIRLVMLNPKQIVISYVV